jgi:alpha-methylacyl-CoA racemase
VLRIDRPTTSNYPTPDQLTRHKSSITLSLKEAGGVALFKELARSADVVIDPYRPGVLEKLGIGPDALRALNPRLIVARLTGFRRDGIYKDMAGHDINYIALSGVLAMLGREGEKPYAPGNLLADFAGGGLMCFVGILLALLYRIRSGRGQVVEANMVDGSSYLASMPRFAMQFPVWNGPRGTNVLDGGCPWYDTYETKDRLYIAVGCLEPQFYDAFIRGLKLDIKSLPNRDDRDNWPELRKQFEASIQSKTRAEWEDIFNGTDACVTPVLSFAELKSRDFQLRPPVDLTDAPGLAVSANKDTSHSAQHQNQTRRGQGGGVKGEGYISQGLVPGRGAEGILKSWLGFEKGKQYDVIDGGHVLLSKGVKARL